MKNLKTITKWLLGAAMAGAFLISVPNKAEAQVAVVQVAGYLPVAPVFYHPYRYEGWRRREYFEHQRWEAERWRRDRWDRYHYRRY